MIYDNKTFEFKGIPSGDGESFCWDVDKENFIKVTGNEPDKYNKSFCHKGLYTIYPNDLYSDTGYDHSEDLFLNKITIERIK